MTKEKQYIYTADNEKIQPQFGFKDFEAIKLSSCFLRSTYLLLHFVGSYLGIYELLNPMPYEVVVAYVILMLWDILEHK